MTIIAERYATINGVALDTYAWRVVDSGYDELLNTPALRGDDMILPTASGRRAYTRVIDATVVSIPLLVIGGYDQDGVPKTDPVKGMLEHRAYLRSNLGLPGATGIDANRGTVPMVFVRGTGLGNLTGQVTFLGLFGWQTVGHGEAMVRIDISIPAGELV